MILNYKQLKINIFLIALFISFSCFSQEKLITGLIIEGGKGNTSQVENGKILQEVTDLGSRRNIDYILNAALGYKLRFKSNEKSFYDIDFLAGIKKINSDIENTGKTDSIFLGYSGRYIFLDFSVSAAYQYKVWKNLYAGIGLSPTYYFFESSERKWRFDLPVTVKVGYDFKYVDLALIYKRGMLHALKSEVFAKGNINDIQLQLFIPF